MSRSRKLLSALVTAAVLLCGWVVWYLAQHRLDEIKGEIEARCGSWTQALGGCPPGKVCSVSERTVIERPECLTIKHDSVGRLIRHRYGCNLTSRALGHNRAPVYWLECSHYEILTRLPLVGEGSLH